MRRIKGVEPQQGHKVQVKPTSSQSTNHLHPAFSFKHMPSGEFDLSQCDKDEKASLSDTMYLLGQLTWAAIQGQNKHANGHEKIARDAIKTGIPSTVTEDVNLLAFRFQGKKAMVGFRKDKIFYVLWLDRSFKLYNHG